MILEISAYKMKFKNIACTKCDKENKALFTFANFFIEKL